MGSDQSADDHEDHAGPAQTGQVSAYKIDAQGATGVQIGENNTLIVYTYDRLTWTDGVAPPPLVSRSGTVDSPYRGLTAV